MCACLEDMFLEVFWVVKLRCFTMLTEEWILDIKGAVGKCRAPVEWRLSKTIYCWIIIFAFHLFSRSFTIESPINSSWINSLFWLNSRDLHRVTGNFAVSEIFIWKFGRMDKIFSFFKYHLKPAIGCQLDTCYKMLKRLSWQALAVLEDHWLCFNASL